MSRKRGAKTKDLPPNLYLRKGIYYYRDIRDKKEYSLGKNKSLAVTEAIQANLAILKPTISLLDRINNIQVVTLHEWLDRYHEIVNKRGLRKNSLRDYKTKISILKANLADSNINELTAKEIASFINNYRSPSMAKLLRTTLSDAFNEAIAAGLANNNPVTITKPPKTKVMRSRLELDQFKTALDNAPKKYGYMFMLSLLTGQRIGDITLLKWEDIKEDRLYIEQSKTGARIAIPLSLRLEAINIDLRSILELLKNDSELICNTSQATLRRIFDKSLPVIENKPTYHEIRSLSARLYESEKGAEFAKKLLGHKSMLMTDKYLDNRNNSFVQL